MKAFDIMTSSVECVTRQDSLSTAAQLMRDADIGAVPVVEDRETMRFIGVITDRDIAIRHVAGDNSADCTVGDHMTSNPLFSVRPDADVNDVMRTMKAEQVRRVAVTETDDRLVGIIAQADIATEGSREDTAEVVARISEPPE